MHVKGVLRQVNAFDFNGSCDTEWLTDNNEDGGGGGGDDDTKGGDDDDDAKGDDDDDEEDEEATRLPIGRPTVTGTALNCSTWYLQGGRGCWMMRSWGTESLLVSLGLTHSYLPMFDGFTWGWAQEHT